MNLKLLSMLFILEVALAIHHQELIMVEIQPIIYEKTLVKRSPITQQNLEPQYVQQTGTEGPPPEYYNFLQQLQLQQGVVQQQQPDPNNLQQVLISRTPQTFVGQPPRPPPRRLTPEQEQQRKLQENIAQKSIREQEVRDVQRQQQAQLHQLYQQNGGVYDTVYLAQLQATPQPQTQYVQVPDTRQVVDLNDQRQYVPLASQQYLQTSIPQQQLEPERVSYSQVQFGSSKLAKSLTTQLLPQAVQQPQTRGELVYTQPQQQVYVQPKSTQQLVYAPQQIRQDVVYTQQQTRPSALPQQYLIETTKVDPEQNQQVVSIPKPKAQSVYFRPQPNYQSLLGQQIESTTPPSRSSIFVSTVSSTNLKPTAIPDIRIPKEQGRSLSQNEFNALLNAGFKVTPTPTVPNTHQYSQSYQPHFTYYRDIGKRQNKPLPKRVQLTTEERRALAKEGIRNLYRVENTDTSESPITYVLALSSPTEKQS